MEAGTEIFSKIQANRWLQALHALFYPKETVYRQRCFGLKSVEKGVIIKEIHGIDKSEHTAQARQNSFQ
ncbi:hypothetical protein A8V49_11250 [Yersinia pestis]|nr:hypothetical protein A8V49_11250 [Yersinia pestis]